MILILLRFIHAVCMYGLLLMVSILAIFHDIGYVHTDKTNERKVCEEVFSYVEANRESLINSMSEIESWFERYYLLYEEDGQVKGCTFEWPYDIEYVSDYTIGRYFAENDWLICLTLPVNSDIVVFETIYGRGMVTDSIDIGFYYSPQDKPAWINSEQLKPIGLNTGQYTYYPMIPEGNGWVPDTSVLDAVDDSLLKSYGLYTERICENFFYYESWY